MIKVLVQVDTGSSKRVEYDEQTLNPIGTRQGSRPYPFPYGFVIGT